MTVIDTGVDVNHAEFAGRQIELLNLQRGIDQPGNFHGTAVSSLIAARGVHLLGIYPRVALREWDASPGGSADSVRDHRGHQRRGRGGTGSDQPEPRRSHRRSAATPVGARRGAPGITGSGRPGRGPVRRQPARLPGGRNARSNRRRHRPTQRRLPRLERLRVQRPLGPRGRSESRRARLAEPHGVPDRNGQQLRRGSRLGRSRVALDPPPVTRSGPGVSASGRHREADQQRPLQHGQRVRPARTFARP